MGVTISIFEDDLNYELVPWDEGDDLVMDDEEYREECGIISYEDIGDDGEDVDDVFGYRDNGDE